MTPEERFERIERNLALQGEHLAMLLEDSKTRSADIEALIEQSRASKEERDKDAENIRQLARIVESQAQAIQRQGDSIDILGRIAGIPEERLDAIQGDKPQ